MMGEIRTRRDAQGAEYVDMGNGVLYRQSGPRVAGVCDPSANPPPPANAVPIGSALTPAMRVECLLRANDLNVPIGHTERMRVDGVPIVLWTSCHGYTVNADGSQTAGAYHGCSVYRDTTPPVSVWRKLAIGASVVVAIAVGLFWDRK